MLLIWLQFCAFCNRGHHYATYIDSTIGNLGNSLPVRFGGPDEEILTKRRERNQLPITASSDLDIFV